MDPDRTNLYRGRKLDAATSAASAMLRRGNLDVRFGILGDEEEVAELVNASWGVQTVCESDVASWIMRGGGGGGGADGASCLVLERDDVLLGAARLTGLSGPGDVVTVDFFSAPLDKLGIRFLSRAARMCAGWGCRTMEVRLQRTNVPAREFLESVGYAAKGATLDGMVVLASEYSPEACNA